jgi:alkaline phosphatase D
VPIRKADGTEPAFHGTGGLQDLATERGVMPMHPSRSGQGMRRIPGVVALSLALLVPVIGSAPAVPVADGVLVAVGDVTAGTALVHVETAKPGPLSIALDPDPPEGPAEVSIEPDVHGAGRAALRHLAPGRRYRYRILSDGQTTTGEFVTAPAPTEATPVRLLWSGDLGAHGHCRSRRYGIFDAMATRRADLFLFVGDTVYADQRCPGVPGGERAAETFAEFRARHRHNIADPAVQTLLRRTSVAAIWDDHEVRGDFSGLTEPLMPVARAAFLAAWPVATPPDEPTRLYRRLRWGGLLEIFVLDTRQYRDPNRRRDGPNKTMLGTAQRRWLVDAVTGSPAVWKLLVSSVPLSLPKGRLISDSWASRSVLGYRTGFAHERDEILAALRTSGVRNVVVVTADVHFAAAIEHVPAPGFRLWELTAGPLAAGTKKPWSPAPGLGSRVVFAHGGEPSFGELEVGTGGLAVRYYAADGRRLWEARLPAEGQM